MDLSCIISSGDLELYVLGLLPQDEAYKVEQLALLFPEVREELDRISESLEGLAAKAEAVPAAHVKAALMEKLRVLKAAEDTPLLPQAESAHVRTTETPVVPMRPPQRRGRPLLAASVIGLLVCIGAIVYLSRQNNQTGREVAQLQNQLNRLEQHNEKQLQQLQAYNQQLQLWQSNDYRKINLTPVPGKPSGQVQLFWNATTHEVYVAGISLPPAPAGKQYQLWAIVNGQPVDAGMLEKENNSVQKMKTFAAADAFAITLENEGGSAVPTMEAMYVMATVS